MAFRVAGRTNGPTFVLQGFPDGRCQTSGDAGAPSALSATLLKAVTFAAHTDAHSWTAEWSIPLQAAGIAIKPGLTLGFNLGARRMETDDWLVWAGTGRENWRLDGAGRLGFE